MIRVLVVDDDHDSADSLAMLLSIHGYETRTAYDGPTALQIAGEFRADLVLLDLGMPLMGGIQVARRLRAGAMRLDHGAQPRLARRDHGEFR